MMRMPPSGPSPQLDSGWPWPSFPQVSCPEWSCGWAVALLFAHGMPTRAAFVVLPSFYEFPRSGEISRG
jgi:hypothetical protein